MKKLAALLVATMIVGLAVSAYAKAEGGISSGDPKIGYVDMNRALNEVKEGRSAKAKLEADGKAKKQKLEIMQKELQKMKEDLDKQRLILSKDALMEKETAFQKKFIELQRTTVEFEREFTEKEASYIRPITEKLAKVIGTVAEGEGYTMVIPRAMALYGLQSDDLTAKVIQKYDKTK